MKDDNKIPAPSRRDVLKGMAAGSLVPLLGSNLLGCGDDSSGEEGPGVAASFLHGVASGDPTEDGVIIWTRATPDAEGLVRVTWEVASDDSFADIVASGTGSTTADVDYTVKVDVAGLEAGTDYRYRFLVQGVESPIGRTRTLPSGSVAAVSFAVLSCSNYPAGFFNVYREVANLDLDAVLHLGDYLYEYDRDGYASERSEEFDRVSDPENEIVTLDDYRTRYAQYRSDADLQAAHAAHPFIMVWDDHEVTNDTWREGAENHQPATEGDFEDRVAAALQAYYEWSPIRPPSTNREIIYRQFIYGDLVDLLMLDTRLVGRDQQIAYADYTQDGEIDLDALRAALADPSRTLLGDEQNTWLKDRLTNSTTRWQVLGQQVLSGRILLPAPIIVALDPANPDLEGGTAAVLEAVQAKSTPPEERTPEQQALLDSAIPYNPDAWDGYKFNQDDIMDHAQESSSRLVVLAGDTHNAWGTQLRDSSNNVVGVEFATASVTSPGLEAFLGEGTAGLFEGFLLLLVDDLQYANISDRGYLVVRFSPDETSASWRFVTNIDSTEYGSLDGRAQDITVSADDLLIA